jgi:hypothetical protein
MNIYNPNAICSKCECKVIDTQYRHDKDAMERKCHNCGNIWFEKPKNTPSPVDESMMIDGEQAVLLEE